MQNWFITDTGALRARCALGDKYTVGNWVEAAIFFRRSGRKIMKLCEAALKQDKQEVSSNLIEIANIEEQAYKMLKDVE